MICFVSTTGFTGGPLAIHQAAVAVEAAGGEAGVLYVRQRKGVWQVTVDERRIGSALGWRGQRKLDKMLAGFGFPAKASFPMEATFVVPEAMPDLAYRLLEAGCPKVAIWWLSVDNFPLGKLATLETQRVLRDCVHVCQSAYARDFVQRQGALQVRMLTDVTDLGDLPAPLPIAERRFDVAYLPSKSRGAEPLVRRLRQEFSVVALTGMTRDQIRDTLLNTKVFLDFGHHPGKDRVPREAVLCGAIPLVRLEGAARFHEDVPLPDALLCETELFFRPEDLVARLHQTFVKAESWQQDLDSYREAIRAEGPVFAEEIKALIKGWH